MSSSEKLSEIAYKHFRVDGYNCAQSILLTIADHWNCKDELIPKVAVCFGGGLARCGSLCGALTGGMMAIGIKYGSNEPSVEKRDTAYELAQEFYKLFEKKNGSVMCTELIGFDLSKPEGREKAQREEVFDKKCTVFLKNAVEALASVTES